MVYLTDEIFDFIVVGSGPSGVMCAQTLTDTGKKVLLIDAGIKAGENVIYPPPENFVDIRLNSVNQHEIFLGKKFESLHWGALKAGAQLSAQRKFVTESIDRLTPLSSTSFFPVESFARGGLGESWGLGCCRFSDKELAAVGLNTFQMDAAYQVVADRIGVSYTPDDIIQYTMHGINGLQPAIKIDDNATRLLNCYKSNENYFKRRNLFTGVPAIALLTQNKDGRFSTRYNNMDFYSNEGLSAYKPSITLDKLEERKNFKYCSNIIITHFKEEEDYITVLGNHITSYETYNFRAKKLLLATNVLNTARIVLRSFEKFEVKLPLLCNPYSYVVCLQPNRLGKISSPVRTSTVQLAMFHDADNQNADIAMTSFYTYSSLLLQQAIKEVPLNFRDGLFLMNYLLPALIVAGVHHPDKTSFSKYVKLVKNESTITGDILDATYLQSDPEKGKIIAREKLFYRAFRKMGCFPLKKIQPASGASIHYAGTIPFCHKEELLTTQFNGRLSCTKNVFIADGSGFNYLPAKSITFTLMANAHVVAQNALKNE